MELALGEALRATGEALFVTCVDIILPTFDTASDLKLSFDVAMTANTNDEFIHGGVWAFMILLPVIANVAFTL